jgi:hypothetical protein
MTQTKEAEILYKIHQLRQMINSGYGRTGKPLPYGRIVKMEQKIKELESLLTKPEE